MDEPIRVMEYEFSGPVSRNDRDLAAAGTCRTIYLNDLMKPVRIREEKSLTEYEYDAAGCLLRKVVDEPSGKREVWTCDYDDGGRPIHARRIGLVKVHGWIPADGDPGVVKLWNQFFEDWKFMPTGYETDEWFGWEEGCRACHRSLTVRSEDGSVKTSFRTDRYDDAGHLVEADYMDADGALYHSERYEYRDDDSLRATFRRLFDRDGTEWSACSALYDGKGRLVARKKGDATVRRIEYHDHECGLWDRMTEFGRDGSVKGEIIRIIEKTD